MIKVSLVSSSERASGVVETLSLIEDQVRITDTGQSDVKRNNHSAFARKVQYRRKRRN